LLGLIERAQPAEQPFAFSLQSGKHEVLVGLVGLAGLGAEFLHQRGAARTSDQRLHDRVRGVVHAVLLVIAAPVSTGLEVQLARSGGLLADVGIDRLFDRLAVIEMIALRERPPT
jgi:hypothetical protein